MRWRIWAGPKTATARPRRADPPGAAAPDLALRDQAFRSSPARVLLLVSLVVVVIFTVQRARSTFLRVERQRDDPAVRALAVELAPPLADLLSLHEGAGVELGAVDLRARALRWKGLLDRHGARARAAEELCGEKVAATRFLSVAERFAGRLEISAR